MCGGVRSGRRISAAIRVAKTAAPLALSGVCVAKAAGPLRDADAASRSREGGDFATQRPWLWPWLCVPRCPSLSESDAAS